MKRFAGKQAIGVKPICFEQVLNFESCIICQAEKLDLVKGCLEKLSKPTEQGYTSLCRDIARFMELTDDELPEHLTTIFRDPIYSEEFCNIKKVEYHKTCRNEYNSQKINRLEKKWKKARFETFTDEGNLINAPACIFCKEPSQLVTPKSDTISRIIHQARLNDNQHLIQELTNGSDIRCHITCYVANVPTKVTETAESKVKVDRESYEAVLKELIAKIESTRHSEQQEFFKLSQLVTAVSNRLAELGFENYGVHSTRLKDQLQSHIPGLRSDKIGREIFLSFDDKVKHLVANAIENNIDDDEIVLVKAINILRKSIHRDGSTPFSGSLNKNFCAEVTVSKTLVAVISSLIEGCESNSIIGESIAKNIAQIIEFNCVKSRKSGVTYARHNIEREQPFPIYLGLMLHSKTGKRHLVDELHEAGLCISYSRVMDIERAIATKMCDKYIEDDCVCPPSLTEGLFTTAAIDNIDHNPTSNSAQYAFHGTGISLIQHFDHPNHDNEKQSIFLEKNDFSNKRKPCLPASYYNIPDTPLVPTNNAVLPVSTVNWDRDIKMEKVNALEYTKNWLQNCTKLMDDSSYENVISWSAYNSRSSRDISKYKSTSTMLPLLKDDINSPAVVQHTMDIVITAVNRINPSQGIVLTADEPVYAIAKEIQWQYPDKYGEDKIVMMLGGLHIEKSFLAVIGSWLEGSGWDDALVKSGITTPGRSEGILKSSHIKRARYAHEVSLTALNIVLYEKFKNDTDFDDCYYFQWIDEQRKTSPQFQYWITVMELEATLLQFIKCLRNAVIDEYVDILEQMSPWYLVTDHTHYGRWLPVLVSDLKQLPEKHPKIYEQFRKGHFTSRQTNKNFSCISDDQLHEQNNKMVKQSASLIGALNDETSLIKWMVSGPELTRLIMEYRDLSSSNEDLRHHDDCKSFQTAFVKNVKDLVKTFQSKGPFSTTELTTIGNERKVMNIISVENVQKASELGVKIYQDYMFDRLVTKRVSIHATIKQSQLKIFKIPKERSINKDKMKLTDASADANLFCKLYIACESRKGNIDEFFEHENNKNPPSISEFGKIRRLTNNSDDILPCLYKSTPGENQTCIEEVNGSVLIINASSFVEDVPPKTIMTVKEYSNNVFNELINSKTETFDRVDVVFENNQENSLKELTSEICAPTKYHSVIDNDTKLPTTKRLFASYFNNSNTKPQLTYLLKSNLIENLTLKKDKKTYSTEDSIVISNDEITNISSLVTPREDTNARLLLHVENAIQNGHQNVIISTADSNIVIVAIFAFKYLLPRISRLWILLRKEGKNYVSAIHDLYEIHSPISDLLPFFHALTGNYPTTSSFNGIGKKTAWKNWMKCREIDSAMLQLIKNDTYKLCEKSMNTLERFVMCMYDSTTNYKSISDCRRVLFTLKNKPIDRIPPTRDALEQHVKRALLQASIWTQCLEKKNISVEPTDWGWIQDKNSKYKPKWTTIPILSDHCQELISCTCKGKCTRCKCALKPLKCTKLCTCNCDTAK